MRIGIITINDCDNYGNRLQNYALQRFLQQKFGEINTVWWSANSYLPITGSPYAFKNIIKYILNWKNQRGDVSKHYVKKGIREYNIKKFTDGHISIKYDYAIKDTLNSQYDYFIVGSDQVWNPFFWGNIDNYSKAYFLQFADNDKRIAYSASFGISELSRKHKKLFKKGLDGISHISVREEVGARIVKELTGRDVPVLVDPTLLLSQKEWQQISFAPEWYDGEKYILTYFLGKVPMVLQKLANEYGYKIYNLMDKEDLNLYTSRVEEFLWLIEHAQLVCTDSFHACVFSIIFNIPFLVVNREQVGMVDMTSRLDTLMKLFGYQDRFVDFNTFDIDFSKVMIMDFSKVVDVQDRERERSLSFFKQAMSIRLT